MSRSSREAAAYATEQCERLQLIGLGPCACGDDLAGECKKCNASPPKVRLVVSLEDLHTVIAESVRIALAATGHRIVASSGADETTTKVRELGRNAASALTLFLEEEG